MFIKILVIFFAISLSSVLVVMARSSLNVKVKGSLSACLFCDVLDGVLTVAIAWLSIWLFGWPAF